MTAEEFIFQHQVLGEEIGCPYYINEDGAIVFTKEYHCYNEVLPDNATFEKDLYIFDNLKYLPKGLIVLGDLHISISNHYIDTVLDDTKCSELYFTYVWDR